MEVSPTFMTGIPLSAILDGPIAAENAARATAGNNKIKMLPRHLRPVVAGGGQGQLGSISTFSRDSMIAATDVKAATVTVVARTPAVEVNGFVGKVSKRRLAETVRTLLRRLFGACIDTLPCQTT
jgi:carbon monoxide dehydrogenase subunit G